MPLSPGPELALAASLVSGAVGPGVFGWMVYTSFMGMAGIGPERLEAEREGARAERMLLEISGVLPKPPGDASTNAMLVHTAVGQVALRALQAILLESPSKPQALAMAERMLTSANRTPNLLRALKGEIAFGLSIVRTAKSLREVELLAGRQPEGGPSLSEVELTDDLRRAWELRDIQYWRRSFKRFGTGPHDPMAIASILDEEARAEDRHKDMGHILSRIMLPEFSNMDRAVANLEASKELTRALRAVLAYRRARGALPSAIGEVGSFKDPMDGRALRYERTPKGFKIWSVGMDRRDDGGRPRPSGATSSSGYDTVVEFP